MAEVEASCGGTQVVSVCSYCGDPVLEAGSRCVELSELGPGIRYDSLADRITSDGDGAEISG